MTQAAFTNAGDGMRVDPERSIMKAPMVLNHASVDVWGQNGGLNGWLGRRDRDQSLQVIVTVARDWSGRGRALRVAWLSRALFRQTGRQQAVGRT